MCDVNRIHRHSLLVPYLLWPNEMLTLAFPYINYRDSSFSRLAASLVLAFTPAMSHGVTIAGTGSYLPEKILTNEDLSKFVETSDEWIVTRTGIKERRIAAADESTSHLGSKVIPLPP